MDVFQEWNKEEYLLYVNNKTDNRHYDNWNMRVYGSEIILYLQKNTHTAPLPLIYSLMPPV